MKQAQPSIGYQSLCFFKVSISSLTACFSMVLPWFWSSHCIYFSCSMFHENFIGLISSIFAGKSMIPEEQTPRWTTEEEDQRVFECQSRNPDLHWPDIATLTGLSGSGKSPRERWNNDLDPNVQRGNFSQEEDDAIICFESLYGNR